MFDTNSNEHPKCSKPWCFDLWCNRSCLNIQPSNKLKQKDLWCLWMHWVSELHIYFKGGWHYQHLRNVMISTAVWLFAGSGSESALPLCARQGTCHLYLSFPLYTAGWFNQIRDCKITKVNIHVGVFCLAFCLGRFFSLRILNMLSTLKT